MPQEVFGMIDSHELKKRDIYLKKLIGFQDTEPVKVITGIRRCGKSSLLKLMVQHLKDTGVLPEQIIEMNFESFDFRGMSADDIYRYVKERIVPGKRMYLFFDELQRIEAWEDAVNAFRVDFDCDIYVTGSNAYLLSSEYSTYLSGRCVEIKMLPLSFREFLAFHDFEVRETQSALGGLRKQVFDKNGERYELREVFDAYMRFGGMPGIADVGLEQEKTLSLFDGIYSTVVIRDILEREKRRGQKQITDPTLLRKIILFLADNIGSSVSIASIGNTLVNEGLLDDGKRKGAPSAHTVQAYVNALLESYFFYEIKRFDIKGKDYLVINGGTLDIHAIGDGIKSNNTESELVGYVEINGGKLNIYSEDEAIQAVSRITVNGGETVIQSINNGIKCAGSIKFNAGSVSIEAQDNALDAAEITRNDACTVTIDGSPYVG